MSVQDVEFIFLGTGTSSGVPVIGCSCPTCTSSDPRDRRLRCGAAIRFTDPEGHPRILLIDVPPDHREQSLRHGLDRCDGIFITHAHVDHVYGLDEVRRYNSLMRAPIAVHAEPEVAEALHRIFQHIYARQDNAHDSFVADLFDVVLEPLRPVPTDPGSCSTPSARGAIRGIESTPSTLRACRCGLSRILFLWPGAPTSLRYLPGPGSRSRGSRRWCSTC